MDRRNFLGKFAGISGAALALPFWSSDSGRRLSELLEANRSTDPFELARDESFWYSVRQAFQLDSNIINFNNGGVSPSPKVVQEAFIASYRMANELPSYNLWRKIAKERDPVREKLAALAGCTPDTLVINRNASEGLETVIFGLRLKEGDEIVLSKYDYPSMIHAWKQRAARDKLVLKWVDMEFPNHRPDQVLEQYAREIGPKTRLVHITHMLNWTGQIAPVRAIADYAKSFGAEVMVDGAHSFAQLDFRIDELNCDYFATSLHKWLCAPFGTGMLYVRKEKIKNLYPLFAAPDPESEDIQKFEHLGTRSFSLEVAINEAIDFHLEIGLAQKAARLRYLREIWMDALRNEPGVEILTSNQKEMSLGMGLLNLPDLRPFVLNGVLLKEYQILISPVNHESLKGVRISPHIYSSKAEVEKLVTSVKDILS